MSDKNSKSSKSKIDREKPITLSFAEAYAKRQDSKERIVRIQEILKKSKHYKRMLSTLSKDVEETYPSLSKQPEDLKRFTEEWINTAIIAIADGPDISEYIASERDRMLMMALLKQIEESGIPNYLPGRPFPDGDGGRGA